MSKNKYTTIEYVCNSCGGRVNVLSSHKKNHKQNTTPLMCFDCKFQKEEYMKERNFWRMIGDALKAKAEGRKFYPVGYWIS